MTTSTLLATQQRVAIPQSDGDHVVVPGGTLVKTGRLKDGRASFARGTSYSEKDSFSINENVREVTMFPAFWDAAALLPRNTKGLSEMGRPALNPDYVLLFAVLLVALLGSQRSVATYLRDDLTWQHLRERLNANRPIGYDEAPVKAPNHNAVKHFLRRVNRDDGIDLDAISQVVIAAATRQAKTMGLLDPSKSLTYRDPDGSQWVNYDGTVFPSPSRYLAGEVSESGQPRRAADGTGLQLKGGDKQVMGLKIMFGSVRTNDYAGRVIIDFAQVLSKTEQGIGDEAAYIVNSAKSLALTLPGMRGITVDSIISGTHHTELARHGIYAISHTTAKSNPNRVAGGRFADGRQEKTIQVEVFHHTTANGRDCKHHIHSVGGDLKQQKFDANGAQVLTPVETVSFEQIANSDGTYRTYLRLRIDCRHGDLSVRLAFMHTPRSGTQFNRGEYLRFYQPSSDAFSYLYGRRNDTESLHNEIKQRIKRMPSYNKRTQLLLVIGIVVAQNAKTQAFERRRAEDRIPALAS